MVIFAKHINDRVYAYNEKRENILNVNGELYNYTDTTITVKRAEIYYIYNQLGEVIATYPYDFNKVDVMILG